MTLSSKLWHVDKTKVPLIRFAKVKTLLRTKAPLIRGECQQRKNFDKGNEGELEKRVDSDGGGHE